MRAAKQVDATYCPLRQPLAGRAGVMLSTVALPVALPSAECGNENARSVEIDQLDALSMPGQAQIVLLENAVRPVA